MSINDYSKQRGDIRRYGARDDGTDCSAAINKAFEIGGDIYVPPEGEFIFTSLRVRPNVNFYSRGGVLKFKDNTAVSGAANYYPISTSPDGINPGYADNVTIEGLIIDGNKANNTSFLVCDAITAAGNNVNVVGCSIIDPPDSGIMWSGVQHGRCDGNYIEGAPDAGIYANDSVGSLDSKGTILSHNRVVGCLAGINVKRYLSLVTVQGNTLWECGSGINTEDFGSGVNGNYCSILNNIVARCGLGLGAGGSSQGIYVQAGTGYIVVGNVIYNCYGQHLAISGCKHSVFVANTIIGTSDGAAASDGINVTNRTGHTVDFNTIAHNKIFGVMGRGTYFQNNIASDNTGNKFHANTVKGAGKDALEIDDRYVSGEFIDNDLDGTGNDLKYNAATGTDRNNRFDGNTLRNAAQTGDTGWQTGSYQRTFANGVRETHGNGSPTVGAWLDGSVSRQVPLAVDGNSMVLREYACTVSGTPGTWVPQYVSTVSPAV